MLAIVFAFLSSPGGAIVTTAAGTLATFVWHRLRGDKQASFVDTIQGVGKTVVDALVKSGFLTTEALTPLATKLLTTGIAAIGLDPNDALVKPILVATIQHCVGDALAEIATLTKQAAADAANLTTIQANAANVPDWIAKATAEGLARVAGMKDMVEVVPPDAPPVIPSIVTATLTTKVTQP